MPLPSRRTVLATVACLPLGIALRPAQGADAFPVRPVRIIVPFTPGGSSDIVARAISQELGSAWSQPVVVDNVPGAGGTLGSERALRAAADGYTLFMGHTGTLAINPWLYPKLGFVPLKAFVPVARAARVPNVLVVNSSVPVSSLAQLVAHAKAHPDKLAYGSGGNGSAAHLTTEYLKLKTGIAMLHVPYRGTAPSVADLLGGQIQVLFTGLPALLPHIRAGKMKALAVSSSQRLSLLPDVQTVAESGVAGTAGFEADQWYGLVAPAGTPADIVTRLNGRINQALASPAVRERLSGEGADPWPTTPTVFGEQIAAELERWGQVVRTAKVVVD